jgi:hypothetical protein
MSGRLNDIEQRARGATPGPWFVVGPPWNEAAPYINAGSDDPHAGSVVCDFIDRDEAEEMHNSEANAEFVAAAREDVPWLLAELRRTQTALEAWLAWSGGQYPDESPGDVIHALSDGTIVLDDGITTWNPLRALTWIERRREDNAARALACGPLGIGHRACRDSAAEEVAARSGTTSPPSEKGGREHGEDTEAAHDA